MTIEQLIKRLKKWPSQYRVINKDGRHITGLHLEACTCEKDITKQKGSIWIRFKE